MSRLSLALSVLLCLGCEREISLPNPIEDQSKHSILIEVKDAKSPNLSIPGLSWQVEGEAVEAKELYADGKVLKAGAFSLNQTSQLTCKSAGLKKTSFIVRASAPGYVSNFKQIRVSAIDSLQYVELALVKLSDVPEEVKWQNNLLLYSNTTTLVPGGLAIAPTNEGEKTFILAAAIQTTGVVNAALSIHLNLGEDTHNPETGLDIQAGDAIEVWFLAENATTWLRRKDQIIQQDVSGKKFISSILENAGTLLAGYGLDPCLEPLLVTLNKPSTQDQTLCVRLRQGNNQVLASRRIAAKSLGPFTLYLPKNVDYTLSLHDGITSESSVIYQNDLPNCTPFAIIKVNK